jgi:hypothetical protein
MSGKSASVAPRIVAAEEFIVIDRFWPQTSRRAAFVEKLTPRETGTPTLRPGLARLVFSSVQN